MRPGDIVWVDFNPTEGHEQRGHRPALIVSERPAGAMVIVVPLTSAPPKTRVHHQMPAGEKIGTALPEQVRAIDTSRITGLLGHARPKDLQIVRHLVARLMNII